MLRVEEKYPYIHDGFVCVINLQWSRGTDQKCIQEIWHLSKFHVSSLIFFRLVKLNSFDVSIH